MDDFSKNLINATSKILREAAGSSEYTPISFRDIYEKGSGWVHEITFRTAKGVFCVIDDTDSVEVFADKANVVTPKEAASLWADYGFGTSQFPTKDVPEDVPEDAPDNLTVEVWVGSSVKFSKLNSK